MQKVNRLMENSWRDRLDSISELPGRASDRELVWLKLEARLSIKKKSRPGFFFWMVAALLLLLLIDPQLLQFDNMQKPVRRAGFLPSNVQPDIVVSKARAQSPATQQVKRTIRSILKPTAAERNNISGLQTQHLTIDSLVEPVNTIAVTQTTIEALPIAKRKLPVVHINELTTSPVMAAPVAANGKKRVAKIRFFNAAADDLPMPLNNTKGNIDQ